MAAKTLEILISLIHGKRRCFLIMERAQSRIIVSMPLQMYIRRNDVHNIIPVTHFAFYIGRNHHILNTCLLYQPCQDFGI